VEEWQMVNWDYPSLRKPTGGLNNSVNARDKKESEKGGVFSETKIGALNRRKTVSGLGGTLKVKQLIAHQVVVTDSQTKKTKRVNLVTVKENAANRQYARQNILTRGAIVEVDFDNSRRLVRITSRPGHSGGVNAVLLTPVQEKAYLQVSEPKPKKEAKKPLPKSKEKAKPAKTEQ